MAVREIGAEEGRPSLHNLTLIAKGRHTSKLTAELLEADIRLKGTEQVAALVADNASVMKCAHKAVTSKPELRHIILHYCAVHNLNNMLKRMFAEEGSRNSTRASKRRSSGKRKGRGGGAATGSGAGTAAVVGAAAVVGSRALAARRGTASHGGDSAEEDSDSDLDSELVDIGEDGAAFDYAHSELDGMLVYFEYHHD